MKNILEEIIESFSAEPPSFEYWNKLADIPVFSREIYGSDFDIKPNEHCFWDSEYGFWRENDEHLRNRIKGMKNEIF